MELKGPDNSVRVRQIRVLGEVVGEPLKIGKQYSATTIQQRNCESETLRVFRLITSQVFGKLIVGDVDGHNLNNLDSTSASASENLEPLEESNDLREHMVGILFSRSKLTHLQKQVQYFGSYFNRFLNKLINFVCSSLFPRYYKSRKFKLNFDTCQKWSALSRDGKRNVTIPDNVIITINFNFAV